ncbi:B3 domain-containing protein At5g57720-like [Raphanus sativus]|uniref:B3 domain-containing protein At5g57720-like n=1 Tax=Raphanus sativus TaxID=3726 RepID=A0A9W3CEA4_RAPSA|nr:B3 domain-containing protein At5g57720-like [Raphanus sativus]
MIFTPYPDLLIIYNSLDVSLSQRLVLPSDYRKYYPTPLPQTAVLRKPEGNFWTVKWTISQDETISFEDGWSKFITDNAPLDRDFLLFSYDGSRTFLVSIFRDGLPVKPKDPVNIQEISDEDDDEIAGDDDGDDQNIIISLSLGSSDEDDVDTTGGEVNNAHGRSRRVTSSQRKRAEAIGDPQMYLDDPSNPDFIALSTCGRTVLVFPKQVIKDYDLKFDGRIKFIDGFGELEAKFGDRKDRLVVHKWKELYERNDATPEDVITCEILREGDVVRSIKTHFLRNDV